MNRHFFFVRLNAQIPDDEVITFSIDFLPRVLSGDLKCMAEEAMATYPHLMNSRMIVLPFSRHSQASAVVLVNPMGVLNSGLEGRGISFMLSLNPGLPVGCLDLSQIGRRLRILLNRVVKMGNEFHGTTFTCHNFKMYAPEGEIVFRLPSSFYRHDCALTLIAQFQSNTQKLTTVRLC